MRVPQLYRGSAATYPLQTLATAATLIPSASNAEIVNVPEGFKEIDLWVMCSTAAQGGTLVLAEFYPQANAPTVANMIRLQEFTIPATDMSISADRSLWGLATGVEYFAKAPFRADVFDQARLVIAMSVNAGQGVFYVRYSFVREIGG